MSSQQADERFIEHYNLKHDPFQQRVPDFKFFAPQRGTVLTDLHKMARFGVQVQAVIGPHGSGKTLLRQAMVASTDKQTVATVVVLGREAASVEAMLKALVAGMGEQDAEPSEEQLRTQIALFQQHGQQVYLLVDDAEQLEDETLDLLERLSGIEEGEQAGEAVLHVVLFAASDLLERLTESGRDGHYHLHKLLPYSEQETREYLAVRLEGAGADIDLLDDEQIAEIHQESAGWPGQINSVARSVLIEGMHDDEVVEEAEPASVAGLPYRHLMAGAAVAMVVVIAVLLSDPDEAQQPAVAQNNTPAAASKPLALPKPEPLRPAVEQPAAVQPEPAAQPVAVEPAPVELPAPVAVVPARTEPAPAPAVKPAPAVAARPAPELAPVPQPAARPAPVVSKPVPAPAPAAVVEAGNGNGIWYMSQDAAQYTLQLLAVSREEAAQRVVGEGDANYRYFRKQVNGKPMYIVTYGRFDDRATAMAAVGKLPSRFRAGKPVPQSMAQIQQYIRQVQ